MERQLNSRHVLLNHLFMIFFQSAVIKDCIMQAMMVDDKGNQEIPLIRLIVLHQKAA
jgi:hypothetical protein